MEHLDQLLEDHESGHLLETEEVYISELVERYGLDSDEIMGVVMAYSKSGATVLEKQDKGQDKPLPVAEAMALIEKRASKQEDTLYVKFWEKGVVRRIYVNHWKGYTVGYFQSYDGQIWQIEAKGTNEFYGMFAGVSLNKHEPKFEVVKII